MKELDDTEIENEPSLQDALKMIAELERCLTAVGKRLGQLEARRPRPECTQDPEWYS
jgi:hypothetical protein